MVLSDGETTVLLDAGLSARETVRRMVSAGLCPESLSGVILSHEHRDHLSGMGPVCRRFKLAAYMTGKTFKNAKPLLGALPRVEPFSCGADFSIGTLCFRPFSISHDAADPAGFTVSAHGIKVGIATDLGVCTSVVAHHLSGCRALFLEANHCPDMLDAGPYPWHLKQRVKSRIGHLSNQAARDLLGRVLWPEVTHVVLAHLSETNNLPEKALSVVGEALGNHSASLIAAHQEQVVDVWIPAKPPPPG